MRHGHVDALPIEVPQVTCQHQKPRLLRQYIFLDMPLGRIQVALRWGRRRRPQHTRLEAVQLRLLLPTASAETHSHRLDALRRHSLQACRLE